MTRYVRTGYSAAQHPAACLHAILHLLQVDIGEAPAAGANVFDDSDEEQELQAPVEAAPQIVAKPKSSKLAELANKKRKEMVRQALGTE